MVTARTRELLIGAGLAHIIASLDRAVAGRETSAAAQERIVMQLFATESALEFERLSIHTVH
jgi:hypothetical protein